MYIVPRNMWQPCLRPLAYKNQSLGIGYVLNWDIKQVRIIW
jgi:hypothetical protein